MDLGNLECSRWHRLYSTDLFIYITYKHIITCHFNNCRYINPKVLVCTLQVCYIIPQLLINSAEIYKTSE